MVAMMLKEKGVPVVCCCETYKFSERIMLDSIVGNERGHFPFSLFLYPPPSLTSILSNFLSYPNSSLTRSHSSPLKPSPSSYNNHNLIVETPSSLLNRTHQAPPSIPLPPQFVIRRFETRGCHGGNHRSWFDPGSKCTGFVEGLQTCSREEYLRREERFF